MSTQIAKTALLTVAPEGLGMVHSILVAEIERRGLPHDTEWPTVKLAAIGEGQGRGGTRQGIGGTDECICPDCGHHEAHERGTPCTDVKCSKCGSMMVGKTAKAAFVRVLKADDTRQAVAGVVYAADDQAVREWIERGSPPEDKPDVVDSHGDWISEENLRSSFDGFMRHVDQLARSGDPRPYGLYHRVLREDTILNQAAMLPRGTRWPTPDSPPLTAAWSWCQENLFDTPAEEWAAIKAEIDKEGGWSLEGLAQR